MLPGIAPSLFSLDKDRHLCEIVVMKKFATVRKLGTRLRVGMVIKYGGEPYRVTLVNDCRARCEPISKTRKVEIQTRLDENGKPIKFEAQASGINISPNSEVEVIRE